MSSGIDLSKIPAMTPPAGVIPNFIDPETLAPLAKYIMYITTVLMFLIFCLRVYVRLRVTNSWGADDCERFFQIVPYYYRNWDAADRQVKFSA